MNTYDSEIFELLSDRISQLALETGLNAPTDSYFKEIFGFADYLCGIFREFEAAEDIRTISTDRLRNINERIYAPVRPDSYKNSYVNPAFAVSVFGPEIGTYMSAFAAELRAAIPSVYELDGEGLCSRLELILEVYGAFGTAAEDMTDVTKENLKDILYMYVYDYCADETLKKLTAQNKPIKDLDERLTRMWNCDGLKALYVSGEYVSDNEIRIYEYLNRLPKETVKAMADTYTEGYIKGFEVTGRDLSIKDTAEVRFNIGFLPMIGFAQENLKKAGLDISVMRAGYSIFTGRSIEKNGLFGGNPNPQYDYDHKDDYALVLDERMKDRRIEVLKDSYEQLKKEAGVYAGPAIIEIFGEEPFEPVDKKEAANYSTEQRKLITQYASKAGKITNDYIPGDQRSFTIIAYPMPSIGERFEEIFKDIIKINTLDYTLYRDIQQKMIDVLDEAEYVHVKGYNGNRTELCVHLHTLEDPSAQTNFENCVADVNIPVGEVFTSPVLNGTNGTLHVSRVFLNGLEYRDLEITVKDGFIEDYSCEGGKKMIEDNILYHHKTLPMGECAIGTNTTAYEAARRYGIEAQMPILIAEKTGPHFAFGDTCYSHCEDLAVFNPDGKEIIARQNECSALRNEDPSKAYFNCHTDITIPYDELGEVAAVRPDGSRIVIISNSRFVLPGCEELNKPLETSL